MFLISGEGGDPEWPFQRQYTFAISNFGEYHFAVVEITPMTMNNTCFIVPSLSIDYWCGDAGGWNFSVDVPYDRTITIFSTQDISVHGLIFSGQLNQRSLTGGFIVLPTDNLDNEYIIDCYAPSGRKATVSISAIYDHTNVSIQSQGVHICLASTEKVTTGFNLASDESVFLETCEADKSLALTNIKSNKKISVVVGSRRVVIPLNSGLDYGVVIEQFPPVGAWGRIYIVPPFHDAPHGWLVRVMAKEADTNVSLSDCPNRSAEYFVLDQQTVHDIALTDVNLICVIVADKPIQVIQYMQSSKSGKYGDPSMIILPPASESQASQTFFIPDTSESFLNHADIVFSQSTSTELFINNKKIPGGKLVNNAGNNNYTYQHVTLDPGLYNISFSTAPEYLFVRTYSHSKQLGAIMAASATASAFNGKNNMRNIFSLSRNKI